MLNMQMGRKSMSIRKPMVLVLAGPNGSGKSTITQYFEKVGEYTNADDIVLSTGMDNFEAAKLVDEKRYNSISNKKDFTFETVLSSEYKMDILRKSLIKIWTRKLQMLDRLTIPNMAEICIICIHRLWTFLRIGVIHL